MKYMSSIEAIERLKRVPKVGDKAATALFQAGYTLAKLGVAVPEDIQKIVGGTMKKAQEVISNAQSILSEDSPPPLLASEHQKEMDEIRWVLKTDSKNLNKLLGGGFKSFSTVGATGPQACHDYDTQVLTPNGIKHYYELDVGDIIYSIDNQGLLTEAKINEVYESFYRGKMYHFRGKNYDLKVTPDHSMFYKLRHSYEYRMEEAVAISTKEGYIRPTGNWYGKEVTHFSIADFIEERKILKYPQKSHPKAPLKPLSINLFLELVGWYISEGSLLKGRRNYPQIRNSTYTDEICDLLDKLKLDYSVYEESKIVIFHSDLADYLERCGVGALNKHIPKELLQYGRVHLKHLYKTLIEGDGHIFSDLDHCTSYFTSSKRLKDDMLILCMKLGYGISYRKIPSEDRIINGRVVHSNTDVRYVLSIDPNAKGWFSYKPKNKRNRTYKNLLEEYYEGLIWCFNTDYGNFFTVRNGKLSISGNTGKTQLANEMVIQVQKMFPDEDDGFTIFIETELDTFSNRRLQQMGAGKGIIYDAKKVILAPSHKTLNVGNQYYQYERCNDIAKSMGVKPRLIVVDSFTAFFQKKYTNRAMLPDRKREMTRHLSYLEDLTKIHNAILYCTCQVIQTPVSPQEAKGGYSSANVYWETGTGYIPWGGNILKHTLGTWVSMVKIGRALYKFTLFDSSELAPGECKILIGSSGLKDSVTREIV